MNRRVFRCGEFQHIRHNRSYTVAMIMPGELGELFTTLDMRTSCRCTLPVFQSLPPVSASMQSTADELIEATSPAPPTSACVRDYPSEAKMDWPVEARPSCSHVWLACVETQLIYNSHPATITSLELVHDAPNMK